MTFWKIVALIFIFASAPVLVYLAVVLFIVAIGFAVGTIDSWISSRDRRKAQRER